MVWAAVTAVGEPCRWGSPAPADVSEIERPEFWFPSEPKPLRRAGATRVLSKGF